jgi:hypothetical protein
MSERARRDSVTHTVRRCDAFAFSWLSVTWYRHVRLDVKLKEQHFDTVCLRVLCDDEMKLTKPKLPINEVTS